MALSDCKVKNEDFENMDIASLSDRPSADGMSAQMLKERFDAGAKRVIMPKFNQLIEMLTSQEGADNIGITPIEGVAGYTVQQILTAVKILLDDKQSIEQSNIDVGKKFDTAEAQALVKEISFSEGSGVFTITKYDGSVKTIDTAIEKVALDVRLDGQQFVLTLVDGTEQRVDLSAFITQTEVKNSDTITLAIESGVIVARIASGSVTMAHLNPEVTAYIEAKEQSAANNAASASVSEQNALNSANSAEQSHQNAKICQEQACLCATQAELSRKAAATSEQNAKTSEQAAKQSETKAATSEENAKKSEENAEQYATELQGSKEEAAASAASAAESAAKAEAEAKKAADIAGGDFVTGSELQAHLDADNPHNIDAEKVGLGNVPNVSTNDQTPTYEVAAENAELKSGEKLGIAFGKIAKAVSSFISHLANRDNPHEVTAKQIRAFSFDDKVPVQNGGLYINSETTEDDKTELKEMFAKLGYALKSYVSLEQIGLVTGEETIESIARALEDGSILITVVNSLSNVSNYPKVVGLLTVTKYNTDRIKFEFLSKQAVSATAVDSYSYYGFAYFVDSEFYWTGWIEDGNPVGYFPINGNLPITGYWFHIRNKLASIFANENQIKLIGREVAGDDSNFRGLVLGNSNLSELKQCASLQDVADGASRSYLLYGEHNKVSGSYSGNGSSVGRTVTISGIGKILIIFTDRGVDNYLSFVSPAGAVCFDLTNGTMNTFTQSVVNYRDNKNLNIGSNSVYFNGYGRTYYYCLL